MAAGRARLAVAGLILGSHNLGHGGTHGPCDFEAVLQDCIVLVGRGLRSALCVAAPVEPHKHLHPSP